MTEPPPGDVPTPPEPTAAHTTTMTIPRESFCAVDIEMVYKGESHGSSPAPETVLANGTGFGCVHQGGVRVGP